MAAFARCRRCGQVCGAMCTSEARAGDWLPALDRACSCGAPAADLEPVIEDDARRATAGGAVLAVLLVPDGWPGDARG